MADAQYGLYYKKACRWVVVVHATDSKVHEFKLMVYVYFIFLSLLFFWGP